MEVRQVQQQGPEIVFSAGQCWLPVQISKTRRLTSSHSANDRRGSKDRSLEREFYVLNPSVNRINDVHGGSGAW